MLTRELPSITDEEALKPSIRDPPSGIFCLVGPDMERLLLLQGREGIE
jgi:hypothetical protein